MDSLAEKEWLIAAFEAQKSTSGYDTMESFVVENIVEALGIYMVVQLGVEVDPDEYFKKHDESSHVFSPYFFKYLNENEKDKNEPFEDYFKRFAERLTK